MTTEQIVWTSIAGYVALFWIAARVFYTREMRDWIVAPDDDRLRQAKVDAGFNSLCMLLWPLFLAGGSVFAAGWVIFYLPSRFVIGGFEAKRKKALRDKADEARFAANRPTEVSLGNIARQR